MLKKKTTFVIGAGASCDFGFPTGPGLQERICGWLKASDNGQQFQSDWVETALRPQLTGPKWAEERTAFLEAARRIIEGMPVAASIDNFLHTHREDHHAVWLGKIGITCAIIEAEQSASILVNHPNGVRKPALEVPAYNKSWFFPFMRMLTMGSDASDARAMLKNVRFVVFNYDRCLELIILLTLQRYYGASSAEAEAILAETEIVHPYGQIGYLSGVEELAVPFGADSVDIAKVAAGIKTFTESVDEDIVQKAKYFVGDCDTLVFLGFGFLPQNIELLKPRELRCARRIHATTLGFSETDKLVIYDYMRDFMADPTDCELGQIEYVGIGSTRSGFIDVKNGTCRELFNNHAVRLAA